MIWKNDSAHFGAPAKFLHWVSALIVMGMLALGYGMGTLERGPLKVELFWWHKSFGSLLFFLVLIRIVWRFMNPQPAENPAHKAWERNLAKLVQFLLYVGMIGMPVSGLLMAAAGDFAAPFFHFFNMPDVIPGKDRALMHLMGEAHEITATCLFAAVGLHGVGAFKHHFIDKDDTLVRMLPAVLPRLGAALAIFAFAGLMGTALFFMTNDEEEEGPHVQQVQKAAVAAPAAKDIADFGPAVPGVQHWTIIPEQSRIGFTANAQGHDFRGQFSEFAGAVYFDPDKLAQSRADIRVAVASVDSGSADRDQMIVMPAWLDAESFPESRFVTDKIEKTAENQYVAHGTLTLRNVSMPDIPFTLQFSQDESGRRIAEMKGQLGIKRLDFGIGSGEWGDTQTVANPLEISISLKAYAD